MERKGFWERFLYMLLFIWQLPQALVGLIILLFCPDRKVFERKRFTTCFTAKNFGGGISLGPICVVRTSCSKNPAYVAHETDGHTLQSRILGPLYLLVIGLPSLLYVTVQKDRVKYNRFYTERWANKIAGITVTPWGSLVFKSRG